MKWYLISVAALWWLMILPDGFQARSPEAIVEQFCQGDADGLGLQSDQGLWKLTFGEGDRIGFPIVLISGFRIIGVRRDQADVLVTVLYDVEGSVLAGWDGLDGPQFRQERKVQRWTFRVGQNGDALGIRMPSVPLAHIFPETLARYIEKEVLSAKSTSVDEADRLREERIRALVKQLMDLARSRGKKESKRTGPTFCGAPTCR